MIKDVRISEHLRCLRYFCTSLDLLEGAYLFVEVRIFSVVTHIFCFCRGQGVKTQCGYALSIELYIVYMIVGLSWSLEMGCVVDSTTTSSQLQ